MKKLIWFLFGSAFGFVLAHFVNKDPRGHELLAQVDARIGEFTDRVTDAYHQQEAQLAEILGGAKDTAAQAVHDAAIDAADVAEAVGDAARKTTD